MKLGLKKQMSLNSNFSENKERFEHICTLPFETFEVGSTRDTIHVEICSKCHPFYTGKQKLVDTGGRVEKFRKKFGLDK